MSKKKRLSEEAFSWVQDTTGKAEESEPVIEPPPAPGKTKAVSKPSRQRFIFVEYDKKDGRIVATHETLREAGKVTSKPWTNLPKDRAAARIALTDELSDKELIEIHNNYKVVISNKKPALVPKD
jgi:hypothetical protein